jgi:hypothetical protein
MANISEIKIPTQPKTFKMHDKDYPISPRENILRALRQEKPLWLPDIFSCSQEAPDALLGGVHAKRSGPPKDGDLEVDWFGVESKWSEAQGSPTPVTTVLSCVTEWQKEIKWPNLAEYDFAAPAPDFVRDEKYALYTRLMSIGFEQFHFLEGFEQALIDLISEPAACRELFEALVDFNIEVFDQKNKAYPYDYVFYHDDWGTARGPFFSVDLLRETVLQPTIRYVRHIQSKGIPVLFHNCGLINDFIPLIVEEIGVNALDLQSINDIKGILTKYGDRITPDLQHPDHYFFFDPDTTVAQVKEKAHEHVDIYGAQANPGAGALYMFIAPDEEIYHGFMDELYDYSLDKYRGL